MKFWLFLLCLNEQEPLSSLAAEYQSGSAILLEKIKVGLYAVCCVVLVSLVVI